MDRICRRIILALLPLSTLFFAASCTHSPPNRAAGVASSPGSQPLRKVGLLVTGPVSDGGWNEIAWKGCQLIHRQLGATINNQLVTRPEEFESSFRGYGADDYDLVFGHGAEFSDAAMRVGPQFPKTKFVVTGGTARGENVSHIRFGMEEVTYLLGILAGSLTHSGKVAEIGGTPLEPVKQAFTAFDQGVRSVNPHAVVTTAYIGNWNDANAGKEQARALIQAGADFLFPNADAAGNGVFQAVQENKQRGVLAFGANSDQTALAPDVILANAVLDVPRAFLLVAQSIRDDRFTGAPYVFGMKDQVVSLVYNPALKSKVPAAVQRKVDAARAAILAGKLKLIRD